MYLFSLDDPLSSYSARRLLAVANLELSSRSFVDIFVGVSGLAWVGLRGDVGSSLF